MARETARRGVDGVVCGHIHHAEITTLNGVLYCNDGDWVESCTALVERHDGTLELLNWTERRELMKSHQGDRAEPAYAARQQVAGAQ